MSETYLYGEFLPRIRDVEITDQNFFQVSEGRVHMGSLYFRLTASGFRLPFSV